MLLCTAFAIFYIEVSRLFANTCGIIARLVSSEAIMYDPYVYNGHCIKTFWTVPLVASQVWSMQVLGVCMTTLF